MNSRFYRASACRGRIAKSNIVGGARVEGV